MVQCRLALRHPLTPAMTSRRVVHVSRRVERSMLPAASLRFPSWARFAITLVALRTSSHRRMRTRLRNPSTTLPRRTFRAIQPAERRTRIHQGSLVWGEGMSLVSTETGSYVVITVRPPAAESLRHSSRERSCLGASSGPIYLSTCPVYSCSKDCGKVCHPRRPAAILNPINATIPFGQTDSEA